MDKFIERKLKPVNSEREPIDSQDKTQRFQFSQNTKEESNEIGHEKKTLEKQNNTSNMDGNPEI